MFWLTRVLAKRPRNITESVRYKKDKAYNAIQFTEKILEHSNARYEIKRDCYEKLRSAKNAYERGQYTIAIELTDDIKRTLQASGHGNRHRR
jgi:putative cell wall-binding protein